MDRIDRKILDILQKDARAPLKEIADRVFLSSPAVSARMARLESSGAIMSYQAQVAAPMLGYMVKAFINHLQQFGRTRTQIVFSTPVEHRGVPVSVEEDAADPQK